MTARVVLESYLQHIATKRSPGTVDIRVRSFTPLCEHVPKKSETKLGELPACALSHQDVYAFLEHVEKPRAQKRRKPQAALERNRLSQPYFFPGIACGLDRRRVTGCGPFCSTWPSSTRSTDEFTSCTLPF